MLDLDARPHLPAVNTSAPAKTLGELLQLRARATPDAASCYQKIGGRWQKLTWQGLLDRASQTARALVEDLGLEAGDAIAILGPTHTDWAVYDFGGQLAGLVTVGVYPKQSAEQVRYLLEHSDTRAIFVADDVEMETVLDAARDLPSLRAIIAWSTDVADRFTGRDERVMSPACLQAGLLDATIIEQRQRQIDLQDTAILIYTSGTTGPPKGAMISHDNILHLARDIDTALPFYQDDLLFAFLPMAHATERCLAFYGRVATGVPAAYATSVGSVLEELPEVRPTVFGSVPRIFEKLYDKVQGQVARSSPVKRAIFSWADGVARRRLRRRLAGKAPAPFLELQYKLASKLAFAKIHQAFGGRVRACITGAAPISYEILEFLWAIDLPILEAYGMTESTVVTHINGLDDFRLGTVGRSLRLVEARIAPDGEILLRGPLTFKGYLKNLDATASTIVDGWLHSGDIGTIDDDGYLRITDRKKHLIITAGGKNVAPANIERAIKNQSPLISNVHAHGDRRPYICALIAPSPMETLDWGLDNGLLSAAQVEALKTELLADPSSRSDDLAAAMAAVVADRRFQQLFREPVQRGNQDLARVEKVRRFTVLDRDFSQEGGELTPTMKMKRKAIEEKYADRFQRVYDDLDYALEAEPAKS